MTQKTALVCGAGGFIGYHLVERYKKEGYWVRGVDIKKPEFSPSTADEFILADLRYPDQAKKALSLNGMVFDEVAQLAANMGGVGFINSNHDAEIMHDSALINLSMAEACRQAKAKKVLYTSSACVYPERNQLDPNNPRCSEDSAYPAAPDTEYGWEKLYSERLYLTYGKEYKMNVKVVRLHNIYGPECTWKGGREKAPAALCRKVAEAVEGGTIEIWGKGDQTRSFLDVDECVDGLRRIMMADHPLPALNLGSEEMISINDLALLIIRISGKKLTLKNIAGPEGVRGRNSNNTLIQKELNWQPSKKLEDGMRKLYPWIEKQVRQ
ncbi:MAG: NAD-dependent epimerase/dehydratase [Parachlamydiales bacterium]|nr:NAD-dependent epimerase/dehydratase [Parachlamydiales bacterium]